MVDRYNLISMQINNFKGLKKVELDFTNEGKPREIITLYGHMGSGKSTLVLAFQWCAYGTSKNKKEILYRQRLFPDYWDGEQKDAISVLIRFRPLGGNPDGSEDIHCKRSMSQEKTIDDLEVIIGTTPVEQSQARELFTQIFGSRPRQNDGVMWVIRKEEMRRMARTFATKADSYYLDFMNLKVPHAGLVELNKAHLKAIDKLSKKSPNVSTADLTKVNSNIDRMDTQLKQIKDDLNEINDDDQGRLTTSDDILLESMDGFKKATEDLAQSTIKLNELKIRLSELPELLNALLYSHLRKKNIPITTSYSNINYDWNEIAEILKSTQTFDVFVIDEIRQMTNDAVYNTYFLLESKEHIPKWIERLNDLKSSKNENLKHQALILEYEELGVTKESTKLVSIKKLISEKNQIKYDKLSKRRIEVRDIKISMEVEKQQILTQMHSLSTSKKEFELKSKQKSVIEAMLNSIDDANDEYLKKMFDLTVDRAKFFWEQIDVLNKYEPYIVKEPMPQIALMNKKNKTTRYIEIDSQGDASGGESQLLLVCTCLAVSESSGAKMPIILDDCFTDLDKHTRQKLVDTVAKHFGSMIFVTNDSDKAALLTSNDGKLVLDWTDTDIESIDTEIHDLWARWE